MSWMFGTTSRRKRISLGWHQGDANSHLFLPSPKSRNCLMIQKTCRKWLKAQGKGMEMVQLFQNFVKRTWRVMRHQPYCEYFFLFALFSIVVVETSCLRDMGESSIFWVRGSYLVEKWSLIFLPVCISHVLVHCLSFSPLNPQKIQVPLLHFSSRSLLILLQQNSSTSLGLLCLSQYEIKVWVRDPSGHSLGLLQKTQGSANEFCLPQLVECLLASLRLKFSVPFGDFSWKTASNKRKFSLFNFF